MPIGYMDSKGVFRESVQEGSEPRDKSLVVAPDGWGYGLQYKNGEWVEYNEPVLVVTVKQAMKALGEDRWQQVEAAIESLPWEAQVDFKASLTWERDNVYVNLMAKSLWNMTDEDIDNLFLYALTL